MEEVYSRFFRLETHKHKLQERIEINSEFVTLKCLTKAIISFDRNINNREATESICRNGSNMLYTL